MSMAANGRLPFSFSWMIINFVLMLATSFKHSVQSWKKRGGKGKGAWGEGIRKEEKKSKAMYSTVHDP